MKQQNVAEKHCDNGQPLRITNQTDRNIKTGIPYHMSVLTVLIIYSFACSSEL